MTHHPAGSRTAGTRRTLISVLLVSLAVGLAPLAAAAQQARPSVRGEDGIQVDFRDEELSVVIDTIADLTGKNFIYDDRVRGRVTIVSPTKISIEEAYAVFESVLQVKGFTTVQGPGGAIKIIPIRDAKESNIETAHGRAAIPHSDRFITRLIPLNYIDADAITTTLKPLVSKDASMVAYAPTNMVILTDAATNISRILQILRSIDVESYKEELTVVRIKHADAPTLAQQLSEIFDAEVGTVAAPSARVRRAQQQAQAAAGLGSAPKGRVRILTDERTNSLIILAARQRLQELRDVIRRLDIPVTGGGRIHVYYLKHADAEELSETLSALISGQSVQSGAGGAGQNVQALRAAITELSEGVSVTHDSPTNSLIIQASQEGYNRLSQVIDQLDIQRPQVLVEALIMEVDVTDALDLGFNGLARIFRRDQSFAVGSFSAGLTEDTNFGDGTDTPPLGSSLLAGLLGGLGTNTFIGTGNIQAGSTLIQGIITASASLNGTNILSAPHILTLDNEEAEIKVGDNIPIVTSRVQSAAGITTIAGGVSEPSLATSQNIERQDIGITLRVTPQISEGNLLRLELEQEITANNPGLTDVTGEASEVGVALSNRQITNTVVVANNETIVIGGLIDERQEDTESKVPWLGDIPILGWLFKTTGDKVTKTNLLIFLTPHIVRNESQLAAVSIRKREEFWASSQSALRLSGKEEELAREIEREAAAAGIETGTYRGSNPVRGRLIDHRKTYPIHRMLEIEESERRAREAAAAVAQADAGKRFGVLAATFGDEGAAAATLQQLLDAGWDGFLETEDHSGTLLFQVKLGPFDSIDEAEGAAATVGPAFDLAPTVILEREDS